MAKLPASQVPDPVDDLDITNQQSAGSGGGGGSGGTSIPNADFLVASLSANVNNQVGPNNPINFDRIDKSRGSSISMDITTNVGRFTLKGGRTYLVSCRIAFGTGSGAVRIHDLYNVTDAATEAGSNFNAWNAAAASTAGGPQTLVTVLAPDADKDYEIRLQATGDTDYQQDETAITIIEIGATANTGEGDYLLASLSADQTTNLGVGNHVEFDSEAKRGTAISLATGAGQANGLFTLTGGKTYEIEVNIGAECNEGTAEMRWYVDPADTELVDDTGNNVGFLWFRDNQAHDRVVHPTQKIVYTPSVDTTIKMEITAQSNLVTVFGSSRVFIREIAAQSTVVAQNIFDSGDATQLDLTGLDGDEDGEYEIDAQLFLTSTNGNLQLQPNLTVSGTRSGLHNGNAAESETTDWRLATWSGISGQQEYSFKMRMWTKRTLNGVTRAVMYTFEGIRFDGSDSFSNVMHGGGYVKALAANLTGLRFLCSVANGILQGSQVTVRRVK